MKIVLRAGNQNEWEQRRGVSIDRDYLSLRVSDHPPQAMQDLSFTLDGIVTMDTLDLTIDAFETDRRSMRSWP